MSDVVIFMLFFAVAKECDLGTFMLVWGVSGLVLSLYWPMRYRHLMLPASWRTFFVLWPFCALLGPLAYFTPNPFRT